MTPAILAAQRAGIPFSIHEYAHDPAAGSYGREAAEALGVDPTRVFKTLIASVDGRLIVALVSAEQTLDLKALAAAVGGKRARMAPQGDAERATGYVVGGISPLGQKRALPCVMDGSALRGEEMFVSAGRRGLEMELAPGDLQRVLQARVAAIGR
ncbi:MAG TPA: Cys-tRNA(Pro) deacylase [Longimicrobiaceae bacterium]|nr:Cys-tRNA(Pro) deacylase [Longimicrobiaceae bacterium]